MSFFEDHIESGDACQNCCQFIGPGEGFMRNCNRCEAARKKASNAKSKANKKAQKVRENVK